MPCRRLDERRRVSAASGRASVGAGAVVCIALLALVLALSGTPSGAAGVAGALADSKPAAAVLADAAGRLAAAYPDHIVGIEAGVIHFRDGTTMPFDDGHGAKSFEAWLARPDVEDMLAQPYAAGPLASPPPPGADPGRARNQAFFDKIYGDCRRGEVTGHLVEVVWLPMTWGKVLKVTSVNGVARRLAAISLALDALPAQFHRYLVPPAGAYNCRVIAGTDRVSAHGAGIAIDIATGEADYWRWSAAKNNAAKPGADGAPVWRNRIPHEIVAIFEAHGFIWGGKWYHYDTMHFEYRPELLPPTAKVE